MTELPKFPKSNITFNPSGERYRVWREEFVAGLHKIIQEVEVARKGNYNLENDCYFRNQLYILNKILEAIGEKGIEV